MRIHTRLTRDEMTAALAGTAGAYFDDLSQHGSRKRDRAWEVKMRGTSARRPNFYNGDGSYAATWDQWGVFLGNVFRADPDATVPGVYDSADDYSRKTFGRFDSPGMPADAHGDHKFDYNGTPCVNGCKSCSARRTWAPETAGV